MELCKIIGYGLRKQGSIPVTQILTTFRHLRLFFEDSCLPSRQAEGYVDALLRNCFATDSRAADPRVKKNAVV
jgi:hypothetical protein